MKNESKKWKRNCPRCGKELIYKTKSQLEYSVNGRPDKRDKPSGLCKECYYSTWTRFSGFNHTGKTKSKMSKQTSGVNNPMFGKKHSIDTRRKIQEKRKLQTISEETRRKMSRSHKLRVTRGEKFVCPNYNRKSISLIEAYGKKHGYDFQHAENGGEFFIAELGYWVDAYDRQKNVVLEVDEKHHYNMDGSLREKDVIRQKEIEEFLSCKFIRIRI